MLDHWIYMACREESKHMEMVALQQAAVLDPRNTMPGL